jgi:hypothetical protein
MTGAIMPTGWGNLDVPIVELKLDEARDHYDDTRSRGDGDPMPDTTSMPIMALYMAGKKTFLGESTILKIQSDYARVIDECTKISIVGVAPVFHDLHVWEPLAKAKAQIRYCGPGITDEYNKWRKGNLKRASDILLDGTWEENFEKLL